MLALIAVLGNEAKATYQHLFQRAAIIVKLIFGRNRWFKREYFAGNFILNRIAATKN